MYDEDRQELARARQRAQQRAKRTAQAQEREVKAWEDRLRRYLVSDFRDDTTYKWILSRLDRAHGNLRRAPTVR